jgi:hypothetical protein
MSIVAAEDILIVNELLQVVGTSSSVNSTTGALVVAGGVGIGENTNIGGNAIVSGTATFQDTLTMGVGATNYTFPTERGSTDQVLVHSSSGGLLFTTIETGSSVGIATLPGQYNLLKTVGTGNDVEPTSVIVSETDDLSGMNTLSTTGPATVGGVLRVESNASSTNTTTGSVIVAGGVGVGENVNAGGSMVVDGVTDLVNTLTIGTGSTSYTFPTIRGTFNQMLFMSTGGSIIMQTPSETIDDVNAPSIFGTDNRLIRTSGTDRDVESTDVILSDTGGITGINDLGVDNEATIGGTLTLTSVTSSTTDATGALVLTGGLGIAENLNVGGDTGLVGVVNVNNTTESNDTTSGALVVDGGVGVAGDVYVGGEIAAGDLDLGNTNLTMSSTTASTDSATGALVVDGGTGIGGDVNIGNDVDIDGALTPGSLTVTDATSSTSNTTGALTIAGGVGIVENLNLGGLMNVNNVTSSTTPLNGAMVVDGGVGVAENVNVGNDIGVEAQMNVNNTTNSTGTGTGALVVDGGMSITKDLYVGGAIYADEPAISNEKFFNAYHTSVVSVASTTFVEIPWDVEVRKDEIYTHAGGAAGITVSETGWYEITAEISSQIEAGDGSSRTIGSTRITVNGTPFGETISFMYNRTAQRGHYTTNITIMQELTAGDVLRVEINRAFGTSTISTVTEANRISLALV